MLLDIFLMLFFICYVVNMWRAYLDAYLDAYLLSNGIFNNLLDIDNTSLLMKGIFGDKNSFILSKSYFGCLNKAFKSNNPLKNV